MTDIGTLRLPRQIQYGYGARHGFSDAVSAMGTRVFVVVDPFLATTDFFVEAMVSLDRCGVVTQVYTGVLPELPVHSLEEAALFAKQFAPNSVVGWGGGSALDAAKLVALLVTHGGELSHYYGENAVPGPILPLLAVPTTAGTGSEATPVAVISDSNRELKVGISSPHLIPRSAIVDPALTMGMPAVVTAHSGIDALVHAIESYTAAKLPVIHGARQPVFVGRNTLCDPLSLEAIRLIGSSIETAVSVPGDSDARASMARGSLLAGMAFGNTGTHLSHAIQYPLGALTHTPHGLGTGLMLPYVMEMCVQVIPDRVAHIGEALGVGADPFAAIDRVSEIASNIGIPTSLAELEIREGDLGKITKLTLASRRLTTISPIQADLDTVGRIVSAAYAGDRTLLRSKSTKGAL